MASMKLVYIAGPYRAPTPLGVEQNIHAAAVVAAQVWRAGLAAVCPHLNTRQMEGVTSDANFLAGTMEMMRRCDAVMVFEGWKDSRGARAEVEEAMRLGLPVLYAWGDEGYSRTILLDLAAMHDGFRTMARFDPSNDSYWVGRYME